VRPRTGASGINSAALVAAAPFTVTTYGDPCRPCQRPL